jgi:hypothetical protein
VLLFSFFLLYFRVFFLEFFYKAFPSSEKSLIDDTMQKIYAVIQNYLLGLIKVIAIIGTLNSIGLWALGIPFRAYPGRECHNALCRGFEGEHQSACSHPFPAGFRKAMGDGRVDPRPAGDGYL